MFLLLAIVASAQCPDDCDDDGWTVDDGDCNDGDPAINPGLLEDCATPIDDNCDRFANEGCDRNAEQGALGGGSACTGSQGTAGLFLLPLLFARRR